MTLKKLALRVLERATHSFSQQTLFVVSVLIDTSHPEFCILSTLTLNSCVYLSCVHAI